MTAAEMTLVRPAPFWRGWQKSPGRWVGLTTVALLAGLAVLALGACTPPEEFTIGGTVTGLNGTGMVLQNNGANDLAIAANGVFSFTGKIEDGNSYAVTVSVAPTAPAQTCEVTSGSGNAGADVTDVAVTCIDGALAPPAADTSFINPGGTGATQVKTAMDKDGNAVVVWIQTGRLRMSEYRSGTWVHPSESAFISPSGGAVQDFEVAMDDLGNAVILWVQVDGLVYMSEYRSGAWKHPADAADKFGDTAKDNFARLALAMSNKGEAVAVFYNASYEVRISEYRKTGVAPNAWGSGPAHGAGFGLARAMDVAMNDKGETVVVWSGNQPGTRTKIYMAEYDPDAVFGQQWTNPADVDDTVSATTIDATGPVIAMDSSGTGGTGNAILLWSQSDVAPGSSPSCSLCSDILMTEKRSGVWSHKTTPGGTSVGKGNVKLAMDNLGNAIILRVNDEAGSNAIKLYKSEYRAGAWSHAADANDTFHPTLAGNSRLNGMAMDNLGNAMVAFPTSSFELGGGFYLSQYREGVWKHPEVEQDIRLSTSDPVVPFMVPVPTSISVAMGDNGEGVMAWAESESSAKPGAVYLLEYRK